MHSQCLLPIFGSVLPPPPSLAFGTIVAFHLSSLQTPLLHTVTCLYAPFVALLHLPSTFAGFYPLISSSITVRSGSIRDVNL